MTKGNINYMRELEYIPELLEDLNNDGGNVQ